MTFRFLDLPRELRDEIYHYIYLPQTTDTSARTIQLSVGAPIVRTNLLETSRQLRDEAI